MSTSDMESKVLDYEDLAHEVDHLDRAAASPWSRFCKMVQLNRDRVRERRQPLASKAWGIL